MNKIGIKIVPSILLAATLQAARRRLWRRRWGSGMSGTSTAMGSRRRSWRPATESPASAACTSTAVHFQTTRAHDPQEKERPGRRTNRLSRSVKSPMSRGSEKCQRREPVMPTGVDC